MHILAVLIIGWFIQGPITEGLLIMAAMFIMVVLHIMTVRVIMHQDTMTHLYIITGITVFIITAGAGKTAGSHRDCRWLFI
jgi:hypothetical protein